MVHRDKVPKATRLPLAAGGRASTKPVWPSGESFFADKAPARRLR
jgi:hypothetical protein